MLNLAAENWYTYRSLVTQRLEVVARTLHERDYEALIDSQEVRYIVLTTSLSLFLDR